MMVTRAVYSCCRRLPVAVLCVSIALLASGCMWGMVKDANTGAPIGGATVTYTDSTGTTASTTTDASGQYSFAEAYWPAPGPVNLRVDASGYRPLTQQVQYAEGSPPLWGVQSLIPASEPEPEPGRYHNARWGFSIRFPEDWTVAEEEEGMAVMGMAPPEDANDGYPELCLVTAEELVPGMTLETYFELMLTSLQDESSELEQLETGEANVNGRDARWVLISLYDPDFDKDTRWLIYALVKDDIGYTIMCVAEATQFANNRSELEGIAESFRID